MKLVMMTPEQAQYILAHAQEYTSKEFAAMFGIDLFAVRNLATRMKTPLKREPSRARIPTVYAKKVIIREAALTPDQPKKKMERPAAIYDNHSPWGIADELRKY